MVLDGVRRDQLFVVGGDCIYVGGGSQLRDVRAVGVELRAEDDESGDDIFIDERSGVGDQSSVHVFDG